MIVGAIGVMMTYHHWPHPTFTPFLSLFFFTGFGITALSLAGLATLILTHTLPCLEQDDSCSTWNLPQKDAPTSLGSTLKTTPHSPQRLIRRPKETASAPVTHGNC